MNAVLHVADLALGSVNARRGGTLTTPRWQTATARWSQYSTQGCKQGDWHYACASVLGSPAKNCRGVPGFVSLAFTC